MKYSHLSVDHPLNVVPGTSQSVVIEQYTGNRQDSVVSSDRSNQENNGRAVWFMRQAGRSLPEYLKLREGTSMLDSCLNSEMATEITLQPVRRHNVDAAIFFSDIMLPLKLAGIGVDIIPGVGPVLDRPIKTVEEVIALPDPGEVLTPEVLTPIIDTVHNVSKELLTLTSQPKPLIGFAGAPFTVAAYMVEGKPSRDHVGIRNLMYEAPEAYSKLMQWVTDVASIFLEAQVVSGASVIQLFDSWAGSLSPENYDQHVRPYSGQIFERLSYYGIPKIHFATQSQPLLESMYSAGANVMGIDDRTSLNIANSIFDHKVPLQGNLDPAILGAPWKKIQAQIDVILEQGHKAPGHVFNLGHGVPPHTDPNVLTRIVDYVHSRP